jgi:hypothetical protein
MKKVLFITSNNLATNPRIVKELQIARKNFKCYVLSFKLSNWSDIIDNVLKASFPDVVFITLEAGRKPFFPWFTVSLMEKMAQIIYPLFKNNVWVNTVAHSKRSYLLWKTLKKLKGSHDLVIAHNMATLYPAFKYAGKENIPYAFDIEDYHPGEYISKDVESEKARRVFLLQKLLPTAFYVSFASPLIGEAILGIVPSLHSKIHFNLNNSFPTNEFISPFVKEEKKLQFVWFSQNIGSGRGLEAFIPILYEFKDIIELTLIGSINEDFHRSFLVNYSEVIKYQEPLAQKELHIFLANFDIGLAIDLGTNDSNREICLTNKIFAYTQSGLFVVATDTLGQSQFIEQHPWCGKVTGYASGEIRELVKILINQRQIIRDTATERYTKSQALSWDLEQQKLLNVWNLLS